MCIFRLCKLLCVRLPTSQIQLALHVIAHESLDLPCVRLPTAQIPYLVVCRGIQGKSMVDAHVGLKVSLVAIKNHIDRALLDPIPSLQIWPLE